MSTVAVAEIQKFRLEFSNYPGVSDVLNVIESCGGNLEIAITTLAERCGQNSNLVLKLVDEQCQEIICNSEFMKMALAPTLGLIANYLTKSHLPTPLSEELAIIVGIYVELGLRGYCKAKTV
ncbi:MULTISPECIES: hypothetical protein [unclassified Anabaena]|uniref:hypothetical protein n=1 Tax=unclassified Anabaena TaxID=2619674 RepID=UPI0039C6B9DA